MAEFGLAIPQSSGDPFTHKILTGEILFMLGANGTGKSSLVGQLFRQNSANAKRISAHRQTWFSSNALNMTAQTREQMAGNFKSWDSDENARYLMHASEERTSASLFDLIDSDTMLEREIATMVRDHDIDGAQKKAAIPSPLRVMNNLMLQSNIPIEIIIEQGQKIVAKKNGGNPYSIAELSDGERSAFLMVAEVLTAKPGTLLLIDEPERHLHRKIVSPLLTLLFAKRSDCAFVVSTHELTLPGDNPSAATLLIRSCEYAGSVAKYWDIDFLPADSSLDEELKLDILGGRQKMIFIEGTPQSLDAPLYSLLFPQVSIIPKSNCRDVEYAVKGLRAAETKHWIKAWGIIDNDRRSAGEVEKLKGCGVFALSHFSIEALYYHPKIIRVVAKAASEFMGKDAEALFQDAILGAIDESAKQREHFVLDAVERLVRREIFNNFPKKSDIQNCPMVKVEVDVNALRASEEVDFDRFIHERNLEAILERYPLRESGALNRIANVLGLKSRADYEDAVRECISKDKEAKSFLKGLFGDLVAEIDSSNTAVPAVANVAGE